jgi:glucokinase
MIILAGDVGGTNTRLALFDSQIGFKSRMIKDKFKNKDFESFFDILDIFLKEQILTIDVACVAVAGPVTNNACELTNLGWMITGAEISKRIKNHPAILINDLQGMTCFVPHANENHLIELNKGVATKEENICVIAPGTGLGEGFLIWQEDHYKAIPSEGGHSDFGPVNQIQQDLLNYIEKTTDHVSYEKVCSGIAIPEIYKFVLQSKIVSDSKEITKKINEVGISNRTIFYYAQSQQSKVCEMTIQIFVEILGAEAGNLALKTFARGGVFLGGGIIPRIIPQVEKYFLAAFIDKGRFSNFMKDIPVSIITHPQPALYGAAYYALQEIK